MNHTVILRKWCGKVATERAAEYARYMTETGGEDLQMLPGNLGYQITTRDLGDGTTEITALSWWTDMEAIKEFVGDEPERAHYYTVDEIYLIDPPEFVEHHTVMSGDITLRHSR
ncbi:MAG: hypothetical protein KKB66_21030 [Alphaproteobacteria bacterium]|jgi:heme-degrading monooxygenase HmoA|nr:hypothetical protein [Alphaproteobacteria bacterium]MBU0804076.1 hypothetical protein [Alphaproteobacteria bacterium]MBU0872627.1 hypothetical protein [Alphaproteobacteria bacterium]MBU1403639.1 hypothetical protein [Alphaproteobacteria bacterium]MBU1593666.1 hypothetical protein [Alphaproteobacteria bacterium]